jgi:hypothetical protein
MPQQRTITTNQSLTLSELTPHIVSNVQLQIKRNKTKQQSPTLWISGPPGLGKSEWMEHICREQGWGLVVVFISQMTIDMLSGMPMIKVTDDGDTEKFVPWSTPEIFNFKHNLQVSPASDDSPVVLLLDDAHTAQKSIQNYMFQLLGSKKIHSHKLPERVAIVLAGNSSDDKAGFQQTLAPIANRMRYIYVDYDVDSWVTNFAIPNQVRPDIISFLQHSEECFSSTPLESSSWASPRSWTYASMELDMLETIIEGGDLSANMVDTVMKGCVGPEYAGKFVEYRQLLAKWVSFEILNGTRKVVLTENDRTSPKDWVISSMNQVDCYALMSATIGELLKHLRNNNFKEDKTVSPMIDIVKDDIIKPLAIKFRAIIPLGLKLLIGEEQSGNKQKVSSPVTRRLLADSEVVALIKDIIVIV